MKRRLFVGALVWTLVVTLLHLWANVGFSQLARGVRESLGLTRPTLRVGFLPVT